MGTYIALLRGINVGGNSPVKMAPLRAAFAALGFDSVVTYLQSGNVVFGAGRGAAGASHRAIGASRRGSAAALGVGAGASHRAIGASRRRSAAAPGGAAGASRHALGTLSLKLAIEQRLVKDLGLSVPVLVLTQDELGRVAASNPFESERGMDRTKLHVTFLFQIPGTAGLAKLEGAAKGNDRYFHRGQAIYLHCPDGYGRSKLANPHLERMLSVPATTRNWNTVNELVRLASS